jgi:hypothetical protein
MCSSFVKMQTLNKKERKNHGKRKGDGQSPAGEKRTLDYASLHKR